MDLWGWLENPSRHQAILWIVDGLRAGTHYATALRNDPEQLELQKDYLAADSIGENEWHPDEVGWDNVTELLALLCELVANMNTGKDDEQWKFPRPVSLADEIRDDVRGQAAMDSFADLGFDMS